MFKQLFQIGLYVVLAANLAIAITTVQGQKLGGTMIYENRNQIDPRPIRLHNIHGIAKAEDGSPVPAMKVGIFTDGTHVLIALTSTDRNGLFAFSHIPAGRYRLVAEYAAFCTANVPIQLQSPARRHSDTAVELHMKVGGIDVCSYGSLSRSAIPNGH